MEPWKTKVSGGNSQAFLVRSTERLRHNLGAMISVGYRFHSPGAFTSGGEPHGSFRARTPHRPQAHSIRFDQDDQLLQFAVGRLTAMSEVSVFGWPALQVLSARAASGMDLNVIAGPRAFGQPRKSSYPRSSTISMPSPPTFFRAPPPFRADWVLDVDPAVTRSAEEVPVARIADTEHCFSATP